MKKIIDIKKEIPLKMIIGARVMDGRTRAGKPIKRIAKILDFGAYILSSATLSFILVSLMILWMN